MNEIAMGKTAPFTIVKTPANEEMVVIPRTLYDRLVSDAEMARDLAAYDKVKARIDAGEEELVPSEIVERILGGENKVRVWREYRGLSNQELAEKVGISAPYLSDIQNGKKEGRLSTLKKIAAVLRVDLDDLV
ncbi:helix-turn-helix domain-containing protein [Phyllobacterium meliloti]|uniref:helix-turn-helix domain-containing protein n=1 Tax=Phyllobacterium meliloti TaxID=555317 RepID=UPI001D1515BE|nr:helix-turn-helix transcriptional regulator [Phyllobacterium sp. T1293]UGX85035.1 helix-turn-helix transcriptional regulator [Phyllobacterium sp. T1293]